MSPDDLVQCVDASPMATTGNIGLVKGALYWVVEVAEGSLISTGAPALGVRVRALEDSCYFPPQEVWDRPNTFLRAERFRPFGGIKQTETDQGEISRVALETWRELCPEIAAFWSGERVTFNCRCVLTPTSNLLG